METTTAGAVTKEYVFGEGIDEVVKARLPDVADVDGDMDTSEKVDLYYHHNSLGSVVAVTDSAGDVVESYRYSPYGEVSIFDSAGSPTAGNVTEVEQPFMFTGRRLDFEEGSGLYYYRLRYFDPMVGRFVSRDPLGMWGDPAQRGNGQSYCGGDPVNRLDPLGLNSPSLKSLEDLAAKDPLVSGFLEELNEQIEGMEDALDELMAELRGAKGLLEEGDILGLLEHLLLMGIEGLDPGAFIGLLWDTGGSQLSCFALGIDEEERERRIGRAVAKTLAAALGALLAGKGKKKGSGAKPKKKVKFTDKAAKTKLRGKSLNAGREKLKSQGLTERVTKTGRHEFVDDKGRVRAAYDPVSQKNGGHWHKFGYDETGRQVSLNDAGHAVSPKQTSAHIPK